LIQNVAQDERIHHQEELIDEGEQKGAKQRALMASQIEAEKRQRLTGLFRLMHD
jgi:hypothetical protein